ncbi:hypothetical protein FQR65_LT16594 [Abscondita terminalis]|nr:hypothetical protein FQR65_LT16594 [Abscondita terminalis]
MGEFDNGILLGDSGYLNLPFLEPQNDRERNYNRSNITSRVKIEDLFGIWK